MTVKREDISLHSCYCKIMENLLDCSRKHTLFPSFHIPLEVHPVIQPEINNICINNIYMIYMLIKKMCTTLTL